MGRKEALAEYTDARRELEVFEHIHRRLLDERDGYAEATQGKLDALKKSIREERAGVENRYFEFELQERRHRSYDAGELRRVFPEAENITGLFHLEVDRDVLDALVRQGIIPADIAKMAERIEEMTPAVIGHQKQRLASERAVREMIRKNKVTA